MKLLMVGGVIVGAALLAKRFARNSGEWSWEQVIDQMPDTAPPKWMFRNITAIRENTDRILNLLESEGASTHGTREGNRGGISDEATTGTSLS